jgi:hypothetical protein
MRGEGRDAAAVVEHFARPQAEKLFNLAPPPIPDPLLLLFTDP